MAYIKVRTTPLNSQEIKEFLTDHLPYRVKILDNLLSYPCQVNTDPLWPSIYESAQITCRMFIQFFGLGVDGKKNHQLKESTDYYLKDKIESYEVKIKDLGVDFIRKIDLSIHEQGILAHAYESANIATAHLTFKTPFNPDPNKVIEAARIIRRLIHDKLHI